MIDFSLNDEHRLLEQSIREWGAQHVAPFIRDNDRTHRFDRERILGGMAKLGLLGISVPQEYGGAGMDYISLGIASEELEYLDTSLRVIMSVHAGLNCLTLLTWGTEEQKQRYLVPQAQGRKISGYGLTEPSAGSDARAIQSTAARTGDRFVLNGEKTWISLADVADHFIVIAWTDAEKKKQRDPSGLSAFIVERTWKGFSSGPMKEKWGILAGNTGFFKMDDVEVPAENMLGRPGEGFKIAMFALDQGRFTVAAGATGLIRACRDASVKYAKERKTFGVEIGQHQLVKEMIAGMESDYQAARLLWLRAGWLKNHGVRNTRETGLAKWFATVASERAAGDAVQIHGANGYSDEYPVGRFFRNCKGAVIYEGTREIHKIMQADYLLGYRTDRPTRCELPAYGEGVKSKA
jgi:glutaryl-CoA dehydrogenase (non-decarboxylating)